MCKILSVCKVVNTFHFTPSLLLIFLPQAFKELVGPMEATFVTGWNSDQPGILRSKEY